MTSQNRLTDWQLERRLLGSSWDILPVHFGFVLMPIDLVQMLSHFKLQCIDCGLAGLMLMVDKTAVKQRVFPKHSRLT